MASRKAQDTPRTPHPSHPARDCTNLHQNTAGTLSANRAELRDTSKQSRSQHLHLRVRDVGAVGSSPVTSTSIKPRKYAVSEISEVAYFFVKTRCGHHRGHHVQNDGKSSRFFRLKSRGSALFQGFGDVRLILQQPQKCSRLSRLKFSYSPP